MRVRFKFIMNALPRHYRLGLLSIIKEMVRQGSSTYYSKIFEENKIRIKPFAYAPYIHNMQIDDMEIRGSQLDLTVSSSSYEFILHLINGSHRHQVFSYQGYTLELKRKRLLPAPPSFSSMVTFNTMSPLLIENKEKRPILNSDHEQFSKELNYFAQLMVRELYGRELYQPLVIHHAYMKKIVIQENLHQESDRPIFLTANQGAIQLEGHPDDLKALYDNGVGRRRSLGLGLLDIKEVKQI